jgi:hypothetical protein
MDLLEVWVRPPFSHNDFSVQFKEKAEKPKHPPSSGSRRAVRFLLVDLWLSNFIQTSSRRHTILPAEVPSARRQGAINPPQADKHNEKQLPKTTQRRIPRFL